MTSSAVIAVPVAWSTTPAGGVAVGRMYSNTLPAICHVSVPNTLHGVRNPVAKSPLVIASASVFCSLGTQLTSSKMPFRLELHVELG